MNLTKEKLLCLWNNREQIFKDKKNKELIDRFDAVKALFEEVENIPITKNNGKYSIDDKEIKYKDNTFPSQNYFGCEEDGISAEGAFNGVQNMVDRFPDEYKELIIKVACILGGFDFGNNKYMNPAYRIVSNTINLDNDNQTLKSNGRSRHPSSNFADNNFFYVIIHTLKFIKENSFKCEESDVVVRWPGHVGEKNTYYKGLSIDEIKTAQQKALRHRFPYKFFYMWTHRDSCIHLLSLMPYQKLAQCGDDCKHLDTQINMDFADFANKEAGNGWKKYSDKIASYIPDEQKCTNFWEEMSKLLSIIAINEDQSIRNTEELLCTGNQAIILWGPPGTSKTYTAELLVKSMLETEKLEEVKFPNQSDKGCYELVQFHPNYAYEDFIGGIAPQVTGNTLAYTLKEGVFKKFCDQANQNTDKKYIFIIDEINRADLSSVFGELLYALEKRGQRVAIPNFTENNYQFVIPPNVYLIGTMNNVDKSLVSFDLALRRRFSFVKMMPEMSVLDTMLTGYSIGDGMANSVEENNLDSYIKRCEWLNERISTSQTLGLNENYQIGQAYFMKIKDFLTKIEDKGKVMITTLDLEKLWEYHLLPLVEEYLGARADEEGVKNELKNIKAEFIKAL